MTRQTGLVMVGVLVIVVTGHSQPAPTPWDPSTRPAWRTPQATIGTPAVDGGDVFAITDDHQLLKFSLADGSEQWRVHTGDWGYTYGHILRTTPTQVLTGEYDIAAFDRVTGRRQWLFKPGVGHAPGPYMGDVAGDVVLAGSASGHLHAISLATGQPRWTTVVHPDPETTVYRPLVAEGEVVAGFTHFSNPYTGGVMAVSLVNGRERWRFTFPRTDVHMSITGGPVITPELVFASSGDGRVWAVNRRTGAAEWSIPALTGPLDAIIQPGARDYRTLGLSGTTLIIGSNTGYVVGYDIRTRREVWRYPGGRLGSTAFTMATTSDLAFVPYVSGYLTAIDVATGELRWRTDDWRQGFMWAPALSGRIAVAGSKHGVWALTIDAEARP